jgi:hypothetical protein
MNHNCKFILSLLKFIRTGQLSLRQFCVCRSAESSEVLQPSEVTGGQGSTGAVVPTSAEACVETGVATPALEVAHMPEMTTPTLVEVPEAGPTSLGGGLHEEGDPGTDEMWHAATSADAQASTAMTTGDSTSSAAGAPPMASDPSPTGSVGVWCLGTLPELGCREEGHLHQ